MRSLGLQRLSETKRSTVLQTLGLSQEELSHDPLEDAEAQAQIRIDVRVLLHRPGREAGLADAPAVVFFCGERFMAGRRRV